MEAKLNLKFEDEIYKKYYPLVFSTCRRFLYKQDFLEDAIQSVFLLYLKKEASLHANLSSWFYWASVNICKVVNSDTKKQLDNLIKLNDYAEQKAKSKSIEESSINLGGVLDKLPKNKREMLLMRYYENLSYREIGAYFKCKENSVRMTIDRTVLFLKEEVKKKEYVTSVLISDLFCLDSATTLNPDKFILQNSLFQQSLIKGVQKMVLFSKLKVALIIFFCFTIPFATFILAEGEKPEANKNEISEEVDNIIKAKENKSKRVIKDIVVSGICSKMHLDGGGGSTPVNKDNFGITINMKDDPVTKGFNVWIDLPEKMNGQNIDFKKFEGKQVIAKGKGVLESLSDKYGIWEAEFTELISLELKPEATEKAVKESGIKSNEEKKNLNNELVLSKEIKPTPELKDITIIGVLTTENFSDITYGFSRQPTQKELDDFKWYIMKEGGGLLTILPYKGIPKEFEYKKLEGELVILKGKGFDEMTNSIDTKHIGTKGMSSSSQLKLKKEMLVTRVVSIASMEIYTPTKNSSELKQVTSEKAVKKSEIKPNEEKAKLKVEPEKLPIKHISTFDKKLNKVIERNTYPSMIIEGKVFDCGGGSFLIRTAPYKGIIWDAQKEKDSKIKLADWLNKNVVISAIVDERVIQKGEDAENPDNLDGGKATKISNDAGEIELIIDRSLKIIESINEIKLAVPPENQKANQPAKKSNPE